MAKVRKRTDAPGPLGWLGGRIGKKADRSYRVRILTQGLFAATSLLLGIQLARFYQAAQAGLLPLPTRPPGVEAYLPISGLMGLLDWAYQGTLNPIHPAATVLVIVALAMAVLLRKAFCSWVCPIGFLSELLARFGRWSFGRNLRIWKRVDIPLRVSKYLILAFFLWAILAMTADQLQAFIQSPYNRVADLKMGLFFVELGKTGTIVIGALVLGSVFVQGFWCRYLCPYGALLGFFSWLSPTRVARNTEPCIDCGLCDKVCMARLPVSSSRTIGNPECTGCLDCMAVCPVDDALEVRTLGRRRLSALVFGGALMVIFLGGYVGARASGAWHNQISDQEYVDRVPEIHSPEYGHPGS
jgi:polyferredoxin